MKIHKVLDYFSNWIYSILIFGSNQEAHKWVAFQKNHHYNLIEL